LEEKQQLNKQQSRKENLNSTPKAHRKINGIKKFQKTTPLKEMIEFFLK
jgi:hypothetical protein